MDLEQAGNLTAWALPVFALLIAAEVGLSAWRGRSAYEARDFLGSMSQLAGNIVVQLVTKGAILALYLWLYQYRLFTIENTLLNLAVLAVVIDFQFYWYHRTSHRVRLFWAVHVADVSRISHRGSGRARGPPILGGTCRGRVAIFAPWKRTS